MLRYFIPAKKTFHRTTDLIFYYLIILFIISLFIKDTPVITNVIIGALLFFAILDIKKFINNRKSINQYAILGYVLFFLYHFIAFLYSNDKSQAMATITLRLPMLLIPLAFFLKEINYETIVRVLVFLFFTTVVASVVGFSYGFFNFITTHDSGFLYNDNICHIIDKQSVYMSFYCVIAIAIGLFVFNKKLIGKHHKLIVGASVIWLVFYLFLLASKTAIVSLFIIILLYVFLLFIKRKKYFESVLIFMSLVIGFVVVSKMFPKILNRFNGITQLEYQFDNANSETHFNEAFDPEKWNSSNTRIAIWNCVIDVWKNNPFIGTGLGDRYKELYDKYRDRNFILALETKKNSHSQYLDVLMSMGIIGLIIFMITYIFFPAYVFYKQKNFLSLIVLLTIVVCLMTENMFDRYQGIIFIPFIISLISKEKENYEKQL